MPDERTYYVQCEDKCLFESMTKEQIIAAIAEATGSTPTSVDDAFITKIKEQNANKPLKFWTGTQAQYNALTPAADTLYLITDPQFDSEITARIDEIEDDIDEINSTSAVEIGTARDWKYRKSANGIYECWITATFTPEQQIVNARNDCMITLPITFADANYIVQMTPSYGAAAIGWYGVKNDEKATSTLGYSYFYNLSTAYKTSFDFYIIGRWKP